MYRLAVRFRLCILDKYSLLNATKRLIEEYKDRCKRTVTMTTVMGSRAGPPSILHPPMRGYLIQHVSPLHVLLSSCAGHIQRGIHFNQETWITHRILQTLVQVFRWPPV